MISARIFVAFIAAAALIGVVASADLKKCDQLLEAVLAKQQKQVDRQPLSNWQKFYELSGESLSSNRVADLSLLRECMELYQKGDAWDQSRRRSQERMKDIEFKIRMAEDSSKLRQARMEAAALHSAMQ